METESIKSGFSDQSLRLKHLKHTSRSNSHRNAHSHTRSVSRYVCFLFIQISKLLYTYHNITVYLVGQSEVTEVNMTV